MNHKRCPEAEIRVIGCLITIGESSNINVQLAFIELDEECFSQPDTRYLYSLVKQQFLQKKLFDVISIMDLLSKASEEIYSTFTRSIKDCYFNPSALPQDIENLVLARNLRKQIAVLVNTLNSLSAEPSLPKCKETIDGAMKEISSLSSGNTKDGSTYKEIAERYIAGEYKDEEYIRTSSAQLNTITGGVPNKSLIVIAAGAGVGKTNIAIWLMHQIHSVQKEKMALFFSFEMEIVKIMQRNIGVIKGNVFDTLDEITKEEAFIDLSESNVTVYDNSRTDIAHIESTARVQAMTQPLSVIVVDYLGLVGNTGRFERNDLRQADVSQRLASLALELNCVVIALSQINRKSAERAKDDRCPYPSDAADSSGSHRSSTWWIGVDRPEMYDNNPYYENMFVMKWRKNRFGRLFEMKMLFNGGAFAEVPEDYFGSLPSTNSKKSYFEAMK